MENIRFGQIKTIIENKKPRSKWGQGVQSYALELLENAVNCGATADTRGDELTAGMLLNYVGGNRIKTGTFRSSIYGLCQAASEGGNFEIYDLAIIDRLCTKSEYKKYVRKDGTCRNAPKGGSWLDLQTRAIFQAMLIIEREASRHEEG